MDTTAKPEVTPEIDLKRIMQMIPHRYPLLMIDRVIEMYADKGAVGIKNVSMGELAQNLQQMAGAYIDHPIVDATGLQGGWDFVMGWTPKAQLQPVPNPNAAAGEASDPNGLSVFEAVEKELGLKLIKTKKSIPVVVVDHVAEKPAQ